MKTKQIATIGVLTALYVVLATFRIEVGAFKFTLEAFPILVVAILLGPLSGLLVGTLGAFIYQLINYGLAGATILYIIPHSISGLVVGLYARKKKLERKNYIFISIISALLVTSLNTLALYIQSSAEGWYSWPTVFGSIPLKIVIGIILSIVYASILPKLIEILKNKVN